MIDSGIDRFAETMKKEEQQTDSEEQETDSEEKSLNVNFLVGLAIGAIVLSTLMVIASDSIEIGDFFDQLSKMNRRALSLASLPFIVALIVLAGYMRKRKEERMWKEALLKTRAKKQAKLEAAKKAAGDVQNQ